MLLRFVLLFLQLPFKVALIFQRVGEDLGRFGGDVWKVLGRFGGGFGGIVDEVLEVWGSKSLISNGS